MYLSRIISDEKKRTKTKKIIIVVAIVFIIVIVISLILIFIRWTKASNMNQIVVYSEDDRNIVKFYKTFSPPEVGKKASLFALEDINTKEIFDLGANRQEWLLLTFQVTGCPNCLLSEANVRQIEENLKGSIKIISISIENDQKKIAEYRDTYNINRLWLYDEKAIVTSGYRINIYPSFILVDPNNMIELISTSHIDPGQVEQIIEEI